MNHHEFIQSYRSGRIQAHINQRAAMMLMNKSEVSKWYLPGSVFRMWIWILSIPSAIASFVLLEWWVGPIVLFLGFTFPIVIKKYSSHYVRKKIFKDEHFFNVAMNHGVIRISE